MRSRTTGKEVSGSSVIDCRTLPLISMVQAPQTSSRQLLSHTIALVCLPSTVTGLRWIAMRHEITFMPGRHSSSNSSQRWLTSASPVGLSWRSTRIRMGLRAVEVPFCEPFVYATWDIYVSDYLGSCCSTDNFGLNAFLNVLWLFSLRGLCTR